ncbi:hypothetical protein C1H46_025319 [Malus baccata]|uniref:Uncharacterized protein n=1 Tax=Malus baccata TaxID=106549 RepID=A0A540LS47_MALBA|nr:hypothetical protein C1H46_025319 [Malus baccata]
MMHKKCAVVGYSFPACSCLPPKGPAALGQSHNKALSSPDARVLCHLGNYGSLPFTSVLLFICLETNTSIWQLLSEVDVDLRRGEQDKEKMEESHKDLAVAKHELAKTKNELQTMAARREEFQAAAATKDKLQEATKGHRCCDKEGREHIREHLIKYKAIIEHYNCGKVDWGCFAKFVEHV